MATKHFVYFIQCKDFIKIGHSVNPELRRRELQTGNPFRLRVLAKIPCECQIHTTSRGKQCAEASRLHAQFRDSKVEYLDLLNEWYHVSDELKKIMIDAVNNAPESDFPV